MKTARLMLAGLLAIGMLGCEKEDGDPAVDIVAASPDEIEEAIPEEAVDDEQDQEMQEAQRGWATEELQQERAPLAAAQVPEDFEIVRMEQVTREVKYNPDPPEGIEVGEGQVLVEYTNFPGFYEIFDEDLLKQCLLEKQKEPFEISFFRMVGANDEAVVAASAVEPCADTALFDASKPGAAQAAAAGGTAPKQIGWAGRGFYKEGGVENPPATGPHGGDWNTFCGPPSGTACTAFTQ